MTLLQRLRSFLFRKSAPPLPVDRAVAMTSVSSLIAPGLIAQPSAEWTASSASPAYAPEEPLPDWLTDEKSLRDEGVLFGLSDARPDGKLAQIRLSFAWQAVSFEGKVDEYTERISELNLAIEQRESRITTLRNQFNDLCDRQPTQHNLIRTGISLLLSVGICFSNFYLIDETLQPIFPNRWIAVGVFLAGMFNLSGQTSFFYEESSRLLGQRLLAEVGLPLSASVLVLAEALQTQSTGQAIALFVFVFFLFLLAGKLLLSTLTTLQTDLNSLLANRQLAMAKAKSGPAWNTEIDQLSREIDAIRMQKWPVVTSLNQMQTEVTRLATRRDERVNLFLSEFELARSLRDRLSEQQREAMFT